ncbi:MAG: DoxX family membrane protein [Desulfobacteraceae bacterium]|nr:DoxX family membrane protein [Desulfobacteraceae bacterium]
MWLYRITRWSIGFIFIYAGSIKLIDPSEFAVLIDAFGIVPENLIKPLAIILPLLETVSGIGLIFDIEASLSIITGLLAIFTAILGYGIKMGLDADCGCFGPQDPESKAYHGLRPSLYRDLFMLILISIIYGQRKYCHTKPLKIKSILTTPISYRQRSISVLALKLLRKPRN